LLTSTIVRIPIAASAERSVDALVRVRRLDARIAGRGIVLERCTPASITIRDGATIRSLPLPRPGISASALLFGAAPLIARLLTRAARSV
jgi:hypothetical protein